ncbi:hypothetical protein C0Q70_12394 [Pomacea canaliculata]|uniref:Uncharacterized protein n=1 Tax=Pomacea canaliculata TaxID=400727 RepID=A0A2T7P1D8_POMCA|nr:hypothetical protein C0Q70_12394 [Pomacea canaliculata]
METRVCIVIALLGVIMVKFNHATNEAPNMLISEKQKPFDQQLLSQEESGEMSGGERRHDGVEDHDYYYDHPTSEQDDQSLIIHTLHTSGEVEVELIIHYQKTDEFL